MLALLLAGCSDGDPGSKGVPGALCTATVGGDGTLSVSCPDGSTVMLAPGSCEEISDASGTQTIRCPDGTEAVVQPGEVLGEGVVVGRVRLMPSRSGAAGARVEVVGTDRFATCAADGSFRVENIPPGTWAIPVTHEPWQPVELDPVPLFGRWNVGEIDLQRGKNFGAVESADEATGSLIARIDSGLVAFRPADGSILEVPGEADHAWWIDGDTVALARWYGPVISLGLWQIDTGAVSWADGFHQYESNGFGILGVKGLGEGQVQLVWISRAGETDLGTLTNGWWSMYSNRPMFHAVGDEGLFLFDATASPQMSQLDARRPGDVQGDGGELIFAEFSEEMRLYNLAGSSFAIQGYTSPWAGLATWYDSSGTYNIYDARTGMLHTLPAGMPLFWDGPENRWLFTQLGGVWNVQPRGGEGPVLGFGASLPEGYSPSGDLVASFDRATMRIVIHNLGAGTGNETLDLPGIDLAGFDWLRFVDEGSIALSIDGELHLATLDGDHYQLGSVGDDYVDLRIANGRVLVRAGTQGGSSTSPPARRQSSGRSGTRASPRTAAGWSGCRAAAACARWTSPPARSICLRTGPRNSSSLTQASSC